MNHESTRVNLLSVAFIFLALAACMTPVMLEYSRWRWHATAVVAGAAVVSLLMRRKAVRNYLPKATTETDLACAALRKRIVSVAGVVVISPVLALLWVEPNVDRRSFQTLVALLATSIAMLMLSFSKRARKRPKA